MESVFDETLEISEEDILKIKDFGEAFDFQDKLGVDFRGINDLESAIERLLLFYRKEIKGEKNPKRQIESDMIKLKAKDEQNRKKLITLLNETREIIISEQLENMDSEQPIGRKAIEQLLKTEGAISNLAEDLNSKLNDVASGECLIVVTENVLPTHHVNCTSVITKILYGPIKKAVVFYHDQKRPPKTFEQYEQVMDLVFVKNQDEREHQSESGIVFVDTPGIGENDAMDEVITQFAAANPIMGFIYVIKSDSAGGVQEDRVKLFHS
ncbi:hypothetical protein KUTeg_020733 [Tegillarca granosa]|uniref:Uncharacterized protein n=1 Tax=Tegillarca granosa TaxID=220873 RepID=A0ABQ9E8S4_TEGGR|nr:hypothetical protein KUTeg_020733 [Tegillarca granosa]